MDLTFGLFSGKGNKKAKKPTYDDRTVMLAMETAVQHVVANQADLITGYDPKTTKTFEPIILAVKKELATKLKGYTPNEGFLRTIVKAKVDTAKTELAKKGPATPAENNGHDVKDEKAATKSGDQVDLRADLDTPPDADGSGSFIAPAPDNTPTVFTAEQEKGNRGVAKIYANNIRFIHQANIPGIGLRLLVVDKDNKLFRIPTKMGATLLQFANKGAIETTAVLLTPTEFEQHIRDGKSLNEEKQRPYNLVGEFNRKANLGNMKFDATKLDTIIGITVVKADLMKAGADPLEEDALLFSFKEGTHTINGASFVGFVDNLTSRAPLAVSFNVVKLESYQRTLENEVARICGKSLDSSDIATAQKPAAEITQPATSEVAPTPEPSHS